MSDKESKVIGFIAQKIGTINLICDGDSAVVAGSEKKMLGHIKQFEKESGQKAYVVKKARFGHILKCLQIGAAYSFDEEAYERFYQLVKDENIKEIEFGNGSNDDTGKVGLHLIRVQWI